MNAVVFIPLTQGKVAVIDFDDFEKVRGVKWYADGSSGEYYARGERSQKSGNPRQSLWMHREIMAPKNQLEVLHIDGNGLNNVRSNLKIGTHQQNHFGYRKPVAGKTSKFRGVYQRGARYRARLTHSGNAFCLGSFATAEDAARAYDKKARELFGEYAAPNFP